MFPEDSDKTPDDVGAKAEGDTRLGQAPRRIVLRCRGVWSHNVITVQDATRESEITCRQ